MTPKKVCLWVLKQKASQNIFYLFFFWYSFKNNRPTNVVFVNIFFKALKKVNNCQKRPKWRFWLLIAFFSAFSKIPTNRTFVRLMFKAESKAKHKEKFVLGFFFKNQKRVFWGSKIVVLKTQISNLFFCVCF